MSWSDFYRRREVLDRALRQARRTGGRVTLAEIPGGYDVFMNEGELLLALQHKWNQLLTGRIGLALDDLDHGAHGAAEDDRVDAISRAWRETARQNPELRAVLDAHGDAFPEQLRAGRDVELSMLALNAGLASAAEPADKIRRVGTALLNLIASTPTRPAGRPRGPVAQLRRLLAPAG
ncbi:hypothetical protein EV191_102284 [Tamaricihabitans halophyticus]|uniref:TetR family transcriptional regulator n=1 Tax=Tamaricihabitans halophyticus TaxID=1262583 RepID=A0A4R2QXY7_9PSEU|nr:hypothetical protein [Tamaricihabitans halophyticus]TCP55072.1 hypothetical protein EV191_102284 [Tamaricihabitans halophyticus]